jgi:hypothetical protein
MSGEDVMEPMKSSRWHDFGSRRALRVALLSLVLGQGASVSGCELIVRFDESKLQDIPPVDAVRPDVVSDSTPSEGGIDAGADVRDMDVSQPDVGTDAGEDSAPEAMAEAGEDSALEAMAEAGEDSALEAMAEAGEDSAPEAAPEPTEEAGVESPPEAGIDASDDAASMVDAAMDGSTD